MSLLQAWVQDNWVAVNKRVIATTVRECTLLSQFALDNVRCGPRKRHGLSTNLMIARQENAKGIRSHLPILVKLCALWWQMLVQALDIALWFGGEGDLESEGLRMRAMQTSGLRLFVSQLRCWSKLFQPLCSLADSTSTRNVQLQYSRSTAADPHTAGALARTPPFLSNKRSIGQNECLWWLQTNSYRIFGEICFWLLLQSPLLSC